ncbi:Autophagy-related protein 18 [Smittium culicis]|uniref:Autophagy-related protein 18 n=1 Tax=Smittium culicis TaxID=133412 RepID=A0A1R1YET1_9FUNG|nr:Autophagy-related protein 18 [Smittium culicis]
MSFNSRSSLLAVTSDSGTVHIFKIDDSVLNSSSSQNLEPGFNRVPSFEQVPPGPPSWNSDYNISSISSPNGSNSAEQQPHYLEYSSSGITVNYTTDENLPESTFQSVSRANNNSSTGNSNDKSKSSWRGLIDGKLIGKAASYMPGSLSKMLEPSRDFAYIRLPKPKIQNIAAMLGTSPQIIVATSEGIAYLYNINLVSGGECTLVKQYNLKEDSDEIPTYLT